MAAEMILPVVGFVVLVICVLVTFCLSFDSGTGRARVASKLKLGRVYEVGPSMLIGGGNITALALMKPQPDKEPEFFLFQVLCPAGSPFVLITQDGVGNIVPKPLSNWDPPSPSTN